MQTNCYHTTGETDAMNDHTPTTPQFAFPYDAELAGTLATGGYAQTTLTCCCGLMTILRYLPAPTDRWATNSPNWKFRKEADRDIHLPGGWYCGQPGHYTEVTTFARAADSPPAKPRGFVGRSETR